MCKLDYYQGTTMANKRLRTMTSDIAECVALLLEIKLGCDIEMVNMGDWSYEDYDKHAQQYDEVILRLRKTGSIYNTDPKILQEACDILENFTKTFQDQKGF